MKYLQIGSMCLSVWTVYGHNECGIVLLSEFAHTRHSLVLELKPRPDNRRQIRNGLIAELFQLKRNCAMRRRRDQTRLESTKYYYIWVGIKRNTKLNS